MDKELLKKAKMIVNFKIHLTIFILGLIFFILLDILFYLLFDFSLLWIIFPIGIWLIFLIFHYYYAYKWNETMIQKELEKLKQKIKTNNNETPS